jgi:hypothetical protein
VKNEAPVSVLELWGVRYQVKDVGRSTSWSAFPQRNGSRSGRQADTVRRSDGNPVELFEPAE